MSPAVLVVQAAPVAAAGLLDMLDDDTRRRLPSRHPAVAASAHALLRLVLSDLTGVAPRDHRIDHVCPSCGGSDHGRPVPRDMALHVSLAGTRSGVAVAVSSEAPVGVDVEQLSATRFDGFEGVVLGPAERAADDAERARAWTRKEAVLKARGTGLSVDPRAVDVRADRSGDCWVLDLPAAPGLAAAVAVRSTQRPRLRLESRDLSR